MTPLETNQIFVQFAGPASPAWLWLLTPTVALAGWFLYRQDLATLARGWRMALVATRCLMLLALAVLAFQPSLVHRITRTFSGRVVFIVDDSRSMTVRDDRMPAAQALRLARRLGLAESTPLHESVQRLLSITGKIRGFERSSRQADRNADTFWDATGKLQQDLDQDWAALFDRLPAARATPEDERRAGELLAKAKAVKDEANSLFVGERWPGHHAFDRLYRQADQLCDAILKLQSDIDARLLASGDKALTQAVTDLRARSRLDLASLQLSQALPNFAAALPGQGFELAGLASPARRPLDAGAIRAISASPAATDLFSPLAGLADETSEFPLSAVVVLSDGRDLSGKPLTPLGAAYARQQVPIHMLKMGSDIEPTDLAVVAVDAPPIAVAGRPMTIRVVLKCATSTPTQATLELTAGNAVVSTVNVTLAPSNRTVAPITFTPESIGRARFTLKVKPAGEVAEALPSENNSGEFVIDVRKEPVHVLLLDSKPRWETRLATSALERLPYVQLNPIIAMASSSQAVPRGGERGSWPATDEDLARYDLVIVGQTPPPLLIESDWNMLQKWVETRGGTIVFLAPKAGESGLTLPEAAVSLLPASLPTSGETTRPAAPPSGNVPRLTPAGARHPITAALAPMLDVAAGSAAGLRPDAAALMVDDTGEWILAWRPLGRGKSLMLSSDALWEPLNPRSQTAHRAMFAQLPLWALEGGWAVDSANAASPKLAIDTRRSLADAGLQVWGTGTSPNATVEATDADGKLLATSHLQQLLATTTLLRAEFGPLPAGNVKLRLKESPGCETGPIDLLPQDMELVDLSRNDDWLSRLSTATGGLARDAGQLPEVMHAVEPRQRIERQEKVWRLWDSAGVLAAVFSLLAIEWIIRKWVGLV